MRMTEAEYGRLLGLARVTIAEHDREAAEAGGVRLHDVALSEVLRIVQEAIRAGMLVGDLDALAESQAMLETAVQRLQRNAARVAAQEVAWAHRDRRPVKRRRARVKLDIDVT